MQILLNMMSVYRRVNGPVGRIFHLEQFRHVRFLPDCEEHRAVIVVMGSDLNQDQSSMFLFSFAQYTSDIAWRHLVNCDHITEIYSHPFTWIPPFMNHFCCEAMQRPVQKVPVAWWQQIVPSVLCYLLAFTRPPTRKLSIVIGQ